MSIIKNPLISYLCECRSLFLQAAACTEWQQDFALGQKACSSIPHLINTSLRQTATRKEGEKKNKEKFKKQTSQMSGSYFLHVYNLSRHQHLDGTVIRGNEE